ncbi:hypothetical protein [Streptosporangium sp. NPDC048865]|uniref:hypothetical protein n=1 Tax=Streptosporangium sp. NPDC048865 TaxID=3155766 RepID=UPI003435877F
MRQAELALPGALIGIVAGAVAGGLTLLAGQSAGWAAISALTLALPLGLLGTGYSILLARNLFRPGLFAPAGLYWLAGFPLARLFQETITGLAVFGQVSLPGGVAGFLAYQAMVSLGFAIGFLWLHERLMPHWLMRLRERNPRARELFAAYVEHAEALWLAKERRRARKGAR